MTGNEIGAVKVGDTEIVRIKAGSTIVWEADEAGDYVYTLINPYFIYSDGTSLSPTAANYATMKATLVKKTKSGTKVSETLVDALPVWASTSQLYYKVIDGKVYFDREKYGKTTLEARTSDKFKAAYYVSASYGNVMSEAITISLAANEHTQYVTNRTVSFSCDKPSISCTETSFTFIGSVTTDWHDDWTSGDWDTHTDNAGDIYFYSDGKYVGRCSNSGEFVYSVGDNKHSLSSYSWDIQAKIDEYSSSVMQVNQDRDSLYSGDSIKSGYAITYNVVSKSISAAGGTAKVFVNAYHYETVKRYWSSDSAYYDESSGVVSDDWTVTKLSGGTRFSTSSSGKYFDVTHSNMAKVETTDSVSYRFYNASDKTSTYTDEVSFSAKNTKTTTETTGEKTYGTPTYTPETRNPSVEISAGSYTSASNPCPASGGTSRLTYSATEETRNKIDTPWSAIVTITYTWDSGSSEAGGTRADTGTDTSYSDWETISVTPTLAQGGTDGFSLNAAGDIVIENRQKTEGSSRSNTYSVSYKSASGSVTVYQQENVASTGYTYSQTCSFSDSSDAPASGGSYLVRYTSYRVGKTTWTSGAEETGSQEAYAMGVTATNCSVPVTSVSGSGSFTATIPANTSTSSRVVLVQIGGGVASKTQKGKTAVTYTFDPQYMGESLEVGQVISEDYFTIIDQGNNNRDYTIEYDSSTALSHSISGNQITFSVESSPIVVDVTISESSSGESILFTIDA